VEPLELTEVLLDGPEWLVVRTFVAGLSPCDALAWFTDAGKLNRWWGEEALIEPRPGGLYEVRWPRLDWVMQGRVAICTTDTLVYSWSWEHEPEVPARTVIVHGEALDDGTALSITHGPYRSDESRLTEEDTDRDGHREGWLTFIPGLHEAIRNDRTS